MTNAIPNNVMNRKSYIEDGIMIDWMGKIVFWRRFICYNLVLVPKRKGKMDYDRKYGLRSYNYSNSE